jgi:hypothetical protein
VNGVGNVAQSLPRQKLPTLTREKSGFAGCTATRAATEVQGSRPKAPFDALELPPFRRTAEAGKRVKAVMASLGWTPLRARHATSRWRAARVRGYYRIG